ncbi:MAG TPA: rhomboid family intramembrane serine protease [Verrucomicrobiales bacterium]|nr:rhomboid family intramembrane serine protease [Verrucomicrobiae bacterium]MCP5553663.1 rhomboid family intramembrane serine protease [Akkermansiaceae bacterium]HRX53134.1 rhomboid family intramembrane serine protease [Verrucomicrobiales bacterium]
MKTEEWRDRLTLLLSMVALMWLVEVADRMLGSWFEPDQWGIVPRQWRGLWGLLTSPFLHADWGHLAANTVPFLVLGGLLLTRSMGQFLQVTVLVAGLGGLCVWLLGPGGTVHIGASGLIFGYFGFLLVAGLVEGSWTSLFIALGVGFLYGSLIWGVLPGEPGISWQGHLFSLLAGAFAGWGKRNREPAIRLE